MDSQLSCYTNWNNLPNEIKLKIIQNADKNFRLALNACSSNDHQLVASIPFRRIHKMYLWNTVGGKWNIDITRTMYGCETFFSFDTFEEFKKKLEEEIENSDFIDSLELAHKETSNQLRFTKFGELLKVRELIFSAHNRDVLNILNQIDLSCLKYLQLLQKGDHRDIFETPQVKQVYHLHVHQDHITDDQLLNMENPEIHLSGTENITLAGINQYMKKCLPNLDNKPVFFRIAVRRTIKFFENLFRGIEIQRIISNPSKLSSEEPGVIQIGSNLSNYQLEIEYWPLYITGRTVCKNQHSERQHTSNPPQKSFETVDSVTIEDGRFTITERNTAPITYTFNSNDDMQMKLTEEMEQISYIKHLELKDTYFNWQLCSPNKQVTVGRLAVLSGSFNSDFLLQIEPIHLKEIAIHVYAESEDGNMYKMPQLINAQKLDILHCWIQDEDLILTNAIQIIIGPCHSTVLTDYGINKFIKKILTNLNLNDYNFQICHFGDEKSASERLEGLDIFSSERIDRFVTRIIVNSPFPEFKLELSDSRRTIRGQRITSEDAEKPRQVNVENDDSDSDDSDSDDSDSDDSDSDDSDSDDSDSDDSYPVGVYSDDDDMN